LLDWISPMIRNPDHVTIAVADADAAIAFFGLLGFELGHVAQIDGGEPAAYMGNPAMKAAHITLVLKGSDPAFEIQLLHFTQPAPDGPVPVPSRTRNRGFNHLAFRVDSLTETAAHLKANGVRALTDEMDYISRRLQFFEGAKQVTIELVEWVEVP
jgi:catechol 2,3-dioxygenase-like lactoylglutathione lyase family enzyme